MPKTVWNRVSKWIFISIIINVGLASMLFSSAADYSTVMLVLFLMLYMNTVLVGLLLKTLQQPLDIMEPYFAFIFLYTLYSWSSAFNEVYQEGAFVSIMPVYYVCITIGIAGFMLGYRYVTRTKSDFIEKMASFKIVTSYKRFLEILLFLTIIFALINYKYLVGIFDVRNIRPYTETALATRAEWSDTSGPIAYLQQLSITFILMCFFLRSFVRKKLSLLSIIFFGAYAIVGIMAGNKSNIISFVTVCLIYYNYYVKRIRIIPVIIIAAILLAFATMINHVRVTTDLSEMAHLATGYIKNDPALLLPMNSTELANPPKSLMYIIYAIQSGRMNFSFGRTWLADILVFIPRVIYPNRSLPTPELYMELFHPLLSKGTGYATFMPTDGYWAFGYAGVFVIMFIYGSMLSFVYRVVKTNIDNGAVVLIYAFAFFTLVTTAVRTGFFGTVKTSIMFLMPFLVILYLSRKRYVELGLGSDNLNISR